MRSYQRRSRNEWIDLVSQQSQSTLSAPQFCQNKSVSYASFMNWKKKLSASALNAHSNGDNTPAAFVEITPDTAQDSTAPLDSDNHHCVLSVTLDLGQGVQLLLHRS